MQIVMMTNTYLPHVGGVARSVDTFAGALRERGHEVLIVAPTFPDTREDEEGVVRMPAIQKFNGSDFSVRLPIPGMLHDTLESFRPEVIHAHHPFLLGDTAQRTAASRNVPLVFTHHTMYEQYTHYVPGDSPQMKRFVIDLATGYANLCDKVIAPSESVASLLEERGVRTPITVVPTGVDATKFARGDGEACRSTHGIPDDAFVVGHVGRLAEEKNLPFLARAAAKHLSRHDASHFIIVGSGSAKDDVEEILRDAGVIERVHFLGTQEGQDLIDALHAMDVFAFASRSETQGLVLAEAMAAGVPAVAVDAPGAREVVDDSENGRLLAELDVDHFAEALGSLAEASPEQRRLLQDAARATGERFSIDNCTDHLVEAYTNLERRHRFTRSEKAAHGTWESMLRVCETEWELWVNRARSAGAALGLSNGDRS